MINLNGFILMIGGSTRDIDIIYMAVFD